MKKEDKGVFTEITADAGKFLTQSELKNEEERIFILIACTTHPEKWEEWTIEQEKSWEIEHSFYGIGLNN